MMNIVHVIPGLYLRGGGGDRACAELAENQASLGHKVTILHLIYDREESFAPAGVKIVPCPPDAGAWGMRIGASKRLLRELESRIGEADIVHIHSLWRYINVGVARIARAGEVPYVVQPHGCLEPWRLAYKGKRKQIWGMLFERRVLSGAAAIHAEGERDRENIERYASGRIIYVVPCGSYPEDFAVPTKYHELSDVWDVPRSKKILSFLGRLDVHKGLDILLESFSRLQDLHDEYHLLIVGPDYSGTGGRLKRMAADLGLESHITWGGMVSDIDKKRLLYQKSFCFILPSYSENFGITVLEALLSRCPVITTTETAWCSLEDVRAGIVVGPTNCELSSGILRMVRLTPQEREIMAANGLEFAMKRYTWKAVAEATLSEYRKIVNGRS